MWKHFCADQERRAHLGGLEAVHQLNDSLQLLPLGLALLLLRHVQRHRPPRLGRLPRARFVGQAVDRRPRAVALFAVYFHLQERKPSISKGCGLFPPPTANGEPHFVGGAGRRAAFAGGAGTVGGRRLAEDQGGVGVGGGQLAAVVEEVQLSTEVVEGEAHDVEEVAVHRLHQHAAQSLDAVAARLVPEADARAAINAVTLAAG